MLNHISLMILFAIVVSVIFSCLGKDTVKERIIFSILLSLGMIAGGLIISWIMFPFPR